MSKANIYTVGGTVQAGSGLYIPRKADQELLELCRARTFAYILSPRQMGKSSLMVRTAEQLSSEGIQSVIIDLTQLGVQVTAEEWYLGLLAAVEDQLMLKTNVVEWWQAHAHVSMAQRLTLFFQEVLLTEITVPIVIFVDEIDTTLSLTFTDDFYAAIRFLYNARAHVPEFRRISFVLIGVATPGDLIRDPQRTPFNIGERVDLTDWTYDEALPLADGLNLPSPKAREVLGWILKWTGGHPYLTQHLCRMVTNDGQGNLSESDIDHIVANAFISGKSEDNNLQFVRDMLTKRAPDPIGTLTTYREIRRGRPVYDEEQSLIKSHLKLSGVVRREKGALHIRNPIYGEVFDSRWIKEHLPVNWTKRLQRTAVALVVTLLALSLPLSFYAFNRAIAAESQRKRADENAAKLQGAMIELQSALEEAKQQRAIALEQQGIAELRSQDAEDQRQRAEQERQKAVQLQKMAEFQRLEAIKQRLIADQRSEEALKQRQEAERLQKVAELERLEAVKQRVIADQRSEEALKQRQEAEKQRQEAERLRTLAETNSQELAQQSAGNEADLSFVQNDYDKAEPLYQQFLDFLRKRFGSTHPDIIKVLNNLASIYVYREKYSEAESFYEEALALAKNNLDPNDLVAFRLTEGYAALLRKQGRDAEAVELETRSINTRSGGLIGTFSGLVLNNRTKDPIDKALVQFINQESGIPSATRTDQDGHFVKDKLLPGTYTIRISATGFKAMETQMPLTGGQSVWVNSKPIMLEPENKRATMND